ncbi:hypothetical protein RN607_00730 [Demequina capsici]|uniref:DUF5047 domain-containing protein n=1 Tax=Demequina capsici TaxID=3075620 RepID=A0AA96FCE5_9MICO|nr:hypothetical protein [Demequina sp. PMTSA13]WNM27558.1 hypothetical protein RN607_00730 [Demequina sp. PMTSA13]
MPEALLPDGLVPVITRSSALTGHRSVRRSYRLLDRDGGDLGPLDGVTGASLTESAAATLKRGGSASITDTEQDIDWLNSRIHATYEVEAGPAWGLGVFIPSAPEEAWSGSTRRWEAELLDVLTVLDEWPLIDGYTLPAGAVVTDEMRAIIALTGETAVAITDSTSTLTTARSWDPHTSALTIFNALADSIGYFSLASDGDGLLRAEPYVRPAARPIVWAFVEGVDCIFRDQFKVTRDIYHVPNVISAVTQGTGDEAGLSVTVYNDNPDSIFSTVSRGRLIGRADGPIVTEATDLDALETIAHRALIDATTPTLTVVIDAMPVPVSTNDAVTFRRAVTGLDGRFVVSRIEYGGAETDLATYTLTEVVDL